MKRTILAALMGALAALSNPGWAQSTSPAPAAAPTAPQPYETRKVDGTDNVYIFRYGNVQSMFVVTPAGVIATDPISYAVPGASKVYVSEIRKVTNQPIKYLIYSHHHFDHIAGGKAFKDAGATIVAHERAKERLTVLQDPNTPLPDQTISKTTTFTLGGTAIELNYLGLNHSDTTLVMRLPKEKIIFAVDIIPVGSLPGRAMIDSFPLEWEDTMKKVLAMDWDKLIPGHPGAPAGRLGTKQDVTDILTFLQEASAQIKEPARAGKCWEPAEKEMQMPKYSKWPGYEQAMPLVARRYCGLWGRGT
jgi:glyoxylase-like metal-dependent hydrolase (beta-lactamase superfamily II)